MVENGTKGFSKGEARPKAGTRTNPMGDLILEDCFVPNENRLGEEGIGVSLFSRTIGFATYNPFGWWVHCGEPAEYVGRDEPYDMIFECRRCQQRQAIEDLD